ncbi:MAG: 30S ribosomal protein S16 [Candidatus Doudnabacteria bacterium]|nr:30S ribosomal protein S16 [Candidatus Doudnabacteria bacterium]
MLIIRLQRIGSKSRPEFRIVLAESLRASGKKFLEILGNYNPRTKNFSIKNQERLKAWIDKNISMSPTVRNLFVEKQLVAGKKVKAWAPKKKETPETQPTAQPAPAAESKPAPTSEAAGVDTEQKQQ